MKGFTRVIAKCTLVMAATASLGSVTALAVENTTPVQNPPAFVENAGAGKGDWKFGEWRNFIGREGGKMTEEGKAARMENFKTALEEKLAAGEITQEKYDAVIANMESDNFKPIKWEDIDVKHEAPKMPIGEMGMWSFPNRS